MSRKKNKIPDFKTDKEVQDFLEQDLSAIDFSQFKPARFEFEPKTRQVNLRMSEGLLKAIKNKAARQGVSYQRYIRRIIESSLTD